MYAKRVQGVEGAQSEMSLIPLGVYSHYKGNQYEVIGFAKHSETLEDMVVYKALYGERGTWVRPLSMWDNPIETGGKIVKRFEYADKAEQKSYRICEIDNALREKVQPILDETWGSPLLAVNGKLWDSKAMPGFVAVSVTSNIENYEVLGYLLYEFHDGVCEIMVLESVAQNIGIATSLMEQVKKIAKLGGVCKVIVQTSNDNTHAFRFYQRRGFTIREIRLGALDTARRLKPSIPLVGEDGIPLRDEIEFEIGV